MNNRTGWSMALMLVVALAWPAGQALAHDRHHPQAAGRMAQALNLSDEQREQMKQIHRATRDAMMRLRDAMEDNREAFRKLDPASAGYMKRARRLAAERGKLVEKMTVLHARERAKIAAVLTPEQRERMRELRKRHRHYRRAGQPHGMGNPGAPDAPDE